MIASLVLLAVEITSDEINQFTTWLAYPLLFYIAYLIYWKEEFSKRKSVITAVLPFIITSLVRKTIHLWDPDIYESWEDFIDIASVFSVIWMIVMLVITSKQDKALAKEREKTLQEEKQNKIMAQLKADLEVQVVERTAELTKQKEELQQALLELKSTQNQLIHSEKMASLGELTAGIAHEIQNPLNFVNNFSEVNKELLDELMEAQTKGDPDAIKAITRDLLENEDKIMHHGKRAEAIVKSMLQHSRTTTGQKEPTDINSLADEYLRLAYHGFRAKDKSFNANFKTELADDLPEINIVPQDIGRVLLNLINNAFQAAKEVDKPEVVVTTKHGVKGIEIRVKDNGPGIPDEIKEKIFQPFFTTKAAGEGTGLGLSLSYDIVTKGHGGELTVESKTRERVPNLNAGQAGGETGTTFTIRLPKT
jgi:signal transduction histidine kinase